jgi:hypothetical protein
MTTATKVKFEPINSAKADTTTEKGVRISLPAYLDVPTHLRKELLNGVRRVIEQEEANTTTTPKTRSGISVVSSQPNLTKVEQYLGMSLSILRSVLFQRGGIAMDLILRLQEVSGFIVITDEELANAFDLRKEFVVGYTKKFPYQ